MSVRGTFRTSRFVECPLAPIVLKKSFWGDERKFLEPLMRFARGDMRDHIVSHKTDHGASYPRYRVSPNQLLRDFRRRSIFDFCNTIRQERTPTFYH